MSFTASLSPPPSPCQGLQRHRIFHNYPSPRTTLLLSPPTRKYIIAADHRNWSRSIHLNDNGFDDDDEEEEDDRSLDLLVKLVENVFNKLSRRARKALRSVLPPSISTQLVGFWVNGVLLLAFFWFLKAFLQVICTLGSAVFVSILLIRVIWSAVAYLQESRNLKANVLDDEHRVWTGSQPAT